MGLRRFLGDMLRDNHCPRCAYHGEKGARVFNVHPTGRNTPQGHREFGCRTCGLLLVIDPELPAVRELGVSSYTANPEFWHLRDDQMETLEAIEARIRELEGKKRQEEKRGGSAQY